MNRQQQRSPEHVITRFWKKVQKNDEGCWLWQGATFRNGYGNFRLQGPERRNIGAHIFSFIISNGQIPDDGKVIMHHCDNPACVRPDHLRVGTRAENTHDMMSKGRARFRGKLYPITRRWDA